MLTSTFALLLGFAAAQDDQAKKIDELIRGLGADEFSAREKASEELRKIGKPAEEALKKALAHEDPEVRERARALLDALSPAEKPRAQAPRRAVPLPLWPVPGARGSSVMVQSVNGDSTYKITPGDGNAPITFHKDKAGAVKLEYTDEKGAAKMVEAESVAKFVADHKELAEKYGITDEGIAYGGSRVSFKGGFQGIPLPRGFNRGRAPVPPALLDEEEERESLRAAGATFEKVAEALRAQLEIPEGQGLVVTRVDPGGAAESAGLRKSDILLEIDGKKVASIKDVKESLGKATSAVVLRKGKREALAPSDPKKDY